MNWQKTILWTPRVLAILYAAFISVFALDVFGEGYGFPVVLWALLMGTLFLASHAKIRR